MEWAAGNLLKQDWPTDNDQLHTKAQDKLKTLQSLLVRKNRVAEAEGMGRVRPAR